MRVPGGFLGDGFVRRAGGVDPTIAPVDGPDRWKFPTTAVQFFTLGLPTPDGIFEFQMSSGNAADTLGGTALTANATPLYRQNISTGSWSRKRIGFNQGTNQRFAFEAGSGPNPAATSVTWLFYAHDFVAPASTRTIFVATSPAAGSAAWIDHTTGNQWRLRTTAGSATFVNAPAANMMVMVGINTSTTTYAAKTTLEELSGTWDASLADGRKGFGGALNASSGSSTGGISYALYWVGADAETVFNKSTLTALGATLPY